MKKGYCEELKQHRTVVTGDENQKGTMMPRKTPWGLQPFGLPSTKREASYFDIPSHSVTGEKFCLHHSTRSIPWNTQVFQYLKAHSTEMAFLEVHMSEEGHKSKQLIHNQGLT